MKLLLLLLSVAAVWSQPCTTAPQINYDTAHVAAGNCTDILLAVSLPSSNGVASGSKCTLACANGYTLASGSLDLQCTDAQWNTLVFECANTTNTTQPAWNPTRTQVGLGDNCTTDADLANHPDVVYFCPDASKCDGGKCVSTSSGSGTPPQITSILDGPCNITNTTGNYACATGVGLTCKDHHCVLENTNTGGTGVFPILGVNATCNITNNTGLYTCAPPLVCKDQHCVPTDNGNGGSGTNLPQIASLLDGPCNITNATGNYTCKMGVSLTCKDHHCVSENTNTSGNTSTGTGGTVFPILGLNSECNLTNNTGIFTCAPPLVCKDKHCASPVDGGNGGNGTNTTNPPPQIVSILNGPCNITNATGNYTCALGVGLTCKDHHCVLENTNTGGTVFPILGLNAECNLTNNTGIYTCAPPLVCKDKHCASPVDGGNGTNTLPQIISILNGPCNLTNATGNYSCAIGVGLTCRDHHCVLENTNTTTGGTVFPILGVNATCNITNNTGIYTCAPPLVCRDKHCVSSDSGNGGGGTTTPPAISSGLNGPCNISNATGVYSCLTGVHLTCKDHTCVSETTTPTRIESGLGGPCNVTTSNTAATTGTTYYCSSGLICQASICVSNTTTIPVDTTPLIVGRGKQCDMVVNGRTQKCESVLKCVNNICVAVGYVGYTCGGSNPPCDTGLVCSSANICSVPPPVLPDPTTSPIGGPCGGTTNARCGDNATCVALSSTQNVSIVGGICAPKVPQTPPPCPAGTGPTRDAVTGAQVCIACPYGTMSAKAGDSCGRCPVLSWTGYAPSGVSSITVGPTTCKACPTTFVADMNCFFTPQCDNCNWADGKMCIWVPSINPLVSVILTTQCVNRVCNPGCGTNQSCERGECHDVNLPPAAKTLVDSVSNLFTNASIPISTFDNASNTIPVTGQQTSPLVLTDPTVVQTGTFNAPVAVDTSLSATNVVLKDGASLTAGSNARVFPENLLQSASLDGTPSSVQITLVPDGNNAPVVNVTKYDLDGNAAVVLGAGSFHVADAVSSSSGGSITVGGNATVTGNYEKLGGIFVGGGNGFQPVFQVGQGALVTPGITGGAGSVVTIQATGILNLTGTVKVEAFKLNGVAVFDNSKQDKIIRVESTVDVAAGASINITGPSGSNDATKVPFIQTIASCNGRVDFTTDTDCTKMQAATTSGTIFTSTSVTGFKCAMRIYGANGACFIDLKVNSDATAQTGSHRRRLLSTDSADCNTATVNNNGATYKVCEAKSAASFTSVSYIALFVTLFVTLCLQL